MSNVDPGKLPQTEGKQAKIHKRLCSKPDGDEVLCHQKGAPHLVAELRGHGGEGAGRVLGRAQNEKADEDDGLLKESFTWRLTNKPNRPF